MVPTAILIGFGVGLLPRPWYLVAIVIGSAAGPLLNTISMGRAFDGPSLFGEFLITAANAAIGAVIARLAVNIVILVRG